MDKRITLDMILEAINYLNKITNKNYKYAAYNNMYKLQCANNGEIIINANSKRELFEGINNIRRFLYND